MSRSNRNDDDISRLPRRSSQPRGGGVRLPSLDMVVVNPHASTTTTTTTTRHRTISALASRPLPPPASASWPLLVHGRHSVGINLSSSLPLANPTVRQDPNHRRGHRPINDSATLTPDVTAATAAATAHVTRAKVDSYPSDAPALGSSAAAPYLVRLAQSCQVHADTVHPPTATAAAVGVPLPEETANDAHPCSQPPPPPQRGNDGGDNGSEQQQQQHLHDHQTTMECREALDSLHRLLPSVESSVRRHTPPNSVEPLSNAQYAVYAADIGHLCDFYNNTMAGGFCPLAPQLWIDPWSVMPRLTSLLQHVVALEVTVDNHDDDNVHLRSIQQQQQHRQVVMEQICTTVARFLNAVPNSVVWHSLHWDWITMAHDLAVVSESRVLVWPASSATIAHDSSVQQRVDLVLWEETVVHLQEQASRQQSFHPEGTKPYPREFSISISSMAAVVALQTVVFNVLEQSVRIRQQQRLPPPLLTPFTNSGAPLNVNAVVSVESIIAIDLEELDDSFQADGTSGNVNARFPWEQCPAGEHVGIRTLLVALRQGCGYLSNEAFIPSETLPVTEAALRVLLALQGDWHATNHAPNLSVVLEASLIVARANLAFWKYRPRQSRVVSPDRTCVAMHLTRLVSALILVPPRVRGSLTQSDVAQAVQRATFSTLRESIRYLHCPSMGQKQQTEDETHGRFRRTVLRALYATLARFDSVTMSGDKVGSTTSSELAAMSRGNIESLICLLNDNLASYAAVFLVARLVPRLDRLVAGHRAMVDTMEDTINEGGMLKSDELNLTSGSKRTASGVYELKLSKRAKCDVSSTAIRSVNFLDDELLQFFGAATSSTLVLRSQLREIGDASTRTGTLFEDSAVHHLVCVSSALRLVLAAVLVVPRPGYFSLDLSEMTQAYLNCMVSVSEALLLHPECDDTSGVTLLREISLACGIFVELSVRSSSVHFLPERFYEEALKYIKLTRDLGKSLRLTPFTTEYSLMCDWFPSDAILETLFGFSLLSKGRVGNSVTLTVFDNVNAFIAANVWKAGSLQLSCSGQLLESISCDLKSQTKRLYILYGRLDVALPVMSTQREVQDQCFDVLKYIDSASSDSLVRLLMWQTLAWLLATVDSQNLRVFFVCASLRKRMLDFITDVAFEDSDTVVRGYASAELGKVLSTSMQRGLLVLMSSDDEWLALTSDNKGSETLNFSIQGAQSILSRFFQSIDCLVQNRCTLYRALESNSSIPDERMASLRDTVRALCSLCDVSFKAACSINIAEHAFRNVIRLSVSVDDVHHITGASVCFFETSRLCERRRLLARPQRCQCAALLLVLVCELLGPLSSLVGTSSVEIGRATWRRIETRFERLSASIETLLDSWRLSADADEFPPNENELERFVESCLPYMLARLVVDINYSMLLLLAGYKLYLGRKREADKLGEKSRIAFNSKDNSMGAPARDRVTSLLKQSDRNLEKSVHDFCLASGAVEVIVQHVFMKDEPNVGSFFTGVVLQNKVTMKQAVSAKEMLLLKNFVIELGRSPEKAPSVICAMKSASTVLYDDNSQESKYPAAVADAYTIKAWVTKHFMYLLVNIAQSKTSKSRQDQVDALRSLLYTLDFLPPDESPQYFPQIMATVDNVLADDSYHENGNLKLLAVEVLAKFVKLVAKSHWEAVGQNLTSIVVSLVPILSDGAGMEGLTPCRRCAVDLLLGLTKGELGQKLAPFFAETPFLPSSNDLDSVHASLRMIGVNFDRVRIVPTQEVANSTPGDSGSSNGDSNLASNDAWQAELRRRLETVCPLLQNERASVRRVVLQHLTTVLRSNRDLFYALVDNESAASVKRSVTVAYRDKLEYPGGTVMQLLDTLLSRCVHENDSEARLLVATCLGEIGAIAAHRFDDSAGESNRTTGRRRLIDPPWYSSPQEYQLHLMINHLVPAITGAPKVWDQNKIAFAIQQVLSLLNQTVDVCLSHDRRGGGPARMEAERAETARSKEDMRSSLVRLLTDAQIFDAVEPFWSSKFKEIEQHNYRPREPPFFQISTSFFDWMSRCCRYMLHRAHVTKVNGWTSVFFACRTAMRTEAGLGLAEFMFPMLLLDRLCFGNGVDQSTIYGEIHDVLTFDERRAQQARPMPLTDHRKAIDTIFCALDLLQEWAEPEYKARQSQASVLEIGKPQIAKADEWRQSEATASIKDFVKKVNLTLRAKAAASVGMQATALRYLEMASRLTVVDAAFGKGGGATHLRAQNRSRAAGRCPESDIRLMKDVLSSLNDFETATALGDDDVWASPRTRARDSIRHKEALKDWQGALHDYECAQQLNIRDSVSCVGVLRCLVELGHFDSVLHHSGCGGRDGFSDVIRPPLVAIPLAVEAAWRLGRWDILSRLAENEESETYEPSSLYQIYLGQTMLHVHKKELGNISICIGKARSSVMDDLTSAARESYSRAYDQLVQLQVLREIEDVSDFICSRQLDHITLEELVEGNSFSWNRRLEVASSTGAASIINSRMVLARLAGDSSLEGSLHLRMGKKNRKNGQFSVAGTSFALAEVAFKGIQSIKQPSLKSSLRLQFAKLKHASGDCSTALRMLDLENIETMGSLRDADLVRSSCNLIVGTLGIEQEKMDEKQLIDIFIRSALQSTRWMVEGGLKGVSEILARFRIIHRLAPTFEKGHFQFARYIDALLQSRILALQGRSSTQLAGAEDERLRSYTISSDKTCMTFMGLSIKHYSEAVILDVKHVYQALPRLLYLWFELSAIKEELTVKPDQEQLHLLLKQNQDEVNSFIASSFKKISAQALYTAVPQLISRITHANNDTATVVQAMLRRVLIKYPAQAMWSLAWVRQSCDEQRKRIGNEIFHYAIEALSKSDNLRRLLVSSKILVDYLYTLAKKEVAEKVRDSMRVKPLSDEVDLSEFVPPIQSALSVSLVSGDSSRSRDLFPRHIPRMRAFDSVVGVMNSKAKPKRLRAFAVAVDSLSRLRRGPRSTKDYDIGEFHFLIKLEAKGDLRKDARVQDLNNFVNRIMSTTDEAKGLSARRRRLHLRTFTVTCLSEDTGMLEWVPHTVSLRGVISKTYNPQADATHGKRYGKRITDFNDSQLRVSFEKKCQEAFFVAGNLSKAAALFESECLRSYPPVLYWWYVQQFTDPHAWYEARTKFALSTAMWSAVGHVIGLGDRHSENILIDRSTGECVHVDFDCIFDKGLYLPKPEVVPFRLTQNMVDAFGPTGADGMYACHLKTAMSTLRENRETLLSVLEPFVKDPVINWKRYRSQQSRSVRSPTTDESIEAKQKMSVIDERLRGVYNLRNPNLRKIRRTDKPSGDNSSDEMVTTSHPIPLSVEGQVYKMIAEATSNENLVQLYVGWMPWV